MIRTIISAERAARSTVILLDCGHERSLGGHVYFNGKAVPAPYRLEGTTYDCQDGPCGRREGRQQA